MARKIERSNGRSEVTPNALEAMKSAAVQLFQERGYHAVTIDDIVKAVGVSKGAFYYYFTSKESLLFQLHDEYVSWSVQRFAELTASQQDPMGKLAAFIREIFGQIDAYQQHVQILFDERRLLPPDKVAIVEEKKDRLRRMLNEIIDEGVRVGVFRPVDTRAVALAIWGMCLWGYQWYRHGGRLTPEEIADIFVDLLLGGLQQKAAVAAVGDVGSTP